MVAQTFNRSGESWDLKTSNNSLTSPSEPNPVGSGASFFAADLTLLPDLKRSRYRSRKLPNHHDLHGLLTIVHFRWFNQLIRSMDLSAICFSVRMKSFEPYFEAIEMRWIAISLICISTIPQTGRAEQFDSLIPQSLDSDNQEIDQLLTDLPSVENQTRLTSLLDEMFSTREADSEFVSFDLDTAIIRAQNTDNSGGGGAGAAAATDPSQPLAQLQLQNVFVPSTYASDGYANQFIIQPVLPLQLNWEFFPFHAIRPTLPVLAPTADPDSPLAGVQGGLGDLTIADVYVHEMKEIKTNIGVGTTYILPTATHAQLGLREWQIGPAMFGITTAVPNWNLGALVEVPFSTQSDAYKVLFQPVMVRTLPDEWYVGVGDLLWVLNDHDGNYDLPLSFRVGKVIELGDQPFNIYLQPQYTPRGFHSGPTAEWGIKLNVTLLFPQASLTDPILAR